MPLQQSHYRDAHDTLLYIENIKQETTCLLYSKTHLMYSGMQVASADFDHAIQCISEVIDDLFRGHRREATYVIQEWEQENTTLSYRLHDGV